MQEATSAMTAVNLEADSDDEGEVPPLLGPSGAATPSVPSQPAVKKAAPPAAAPPPPKPGAHLKPSTGLKKGFLSGGGSSRPNKAASSSSSGSSAGGEVPMVRADVDAKAKSLQLPEVQQNIEAEKA